MDNEKQVKSGKKMEDYNQNILIGILSSAILTIAEMYAVINLRLEVVIVLGVALVLDVFITYKNVNKQKAMKESILDDKIDSLVKSEKAGYLLSRKRFDDIENDIFEMMDKEQDLSIDEIINAQKSLAKVTISRNKENINVILAATDAIQKRLDELDNRLSETEERLNELGNRGTDDNARNISESGKEVLAALRESELSLKNEILRSVANIKIPAPAAAAPIIMPTMAQPVAPADEHVSTPAISDEVIVSESITEEPITEESVIEESVIEEDIVSEPIIEEPIAEESVAEESIAEESMIEEPVTEVTEEEDDVPFLESLSEEMEDAFSEEEVPEMPDLSDPNKQMSADEIAALFANASAFTEPAAEAEPEPVEEPEPVVEPVAEETPPMPDLSDPNKQMSAEDIAALFANASAFTEPAVEAEPEPVEEPEPVADPEPVVEEKPPMPDLSDPNHVMTPDEIAALLANMGS